MILEVLLLTLIAGFMNGSFATLTKHMGKWQEETIWMNFSFMGLFVLPWVTVAVFMPNSLFLLNRIIDSPEMLRLLVGGIVFGLGQVCFAIAFRLIGIGLNFAISISINTVCVALFELVKNPQLFETQYGLFQVLGLLIFILAIVLGIHAGSERGQISNKSHPLSAKTPLVGVILSGVAGIGAAFQGATYFIAQPKIFALIQTSGADVLRASLLTWAILLSVAFLPYGLFFLFLHIRNKSYRRVFIPGTGKYWGYVFFMGLVYWASLVVYSKASNILVATLGATIVWPLFMICIVLTSNLWSWICGEWKEANWTAIKSVQRSTALFVLGLIVFSCNASCISINDQNLSYPSNNGSDVLEQIEKLFCVSGDDMNGIITNFHEDIRKGLCGQESSLKMAPAYIGAPKGTEEGQFLSIDLGGTNFRIFAVEIDGRGNLHIPYAQRYVLEKEVMQGTGEQLFDFIALAIRSFMRMHTISFEEPIQLGFTFSFPVKQENIDSGVLLAWTKGFTAKDVVGKDVVQCLNEALQRQSVQNIHVAALIIDGVATLVTKSYNSPLCRMCAILGTGTDACYLEKIENIKKIEAQGFQEGMIVDTGWGNFDKFSRNRYDEALDGASLNPGQQKLEKLVSGMYLGEILRLVVFDLINKKLLFPGGLEVFSQSGSMKTEDMPLIERDLSSNLDNIEDYLKKVGIQSDLRSRCCLQRICKLISLRSARLSSALVAALILWADPELENTHVVGIDGSLFEKYPGYKENMMKGLAEMFGDKANKISLELVKDGSGIGAAITAAIATR